MLEYGKTRLIDKTQEFEDSRKWRFVIVDEIVRDTKSGEVAIEYEKVLNFLIAKDFVLSEDKGNTRTDKIAELIVAIKEGLFNVCDLEHRSVSQTIIDRKKASG
jgi:hypothetical protein